MTASSPIYGTFPKLSQDALQGMELLGFPIYVYDFRTEHILWSNQAALQFWNAESAEELVARDLTPYSDATRFRLTEYLESFRKGEKREESWTLYPKGIPTPTLSRCRGVSLDGSAEAMLVEIQQLTLADLPVAELRAIEALRHTPVMISLFSQAGKVLMRNPAAQAFYCDMDQSSDASADLFSAMFSDPHDCQMLLQQAQKTRRPAIRSVTMSAAECPVHAVQLSLVSDPVSGDEARLVAQLDMTEITQVLRQLEASEAALDSVLSLNVGPVLVIATGDDSLLKANFPAQALLGSFLTGNVDAHQFFADPAEYDSLRGAILAGGSSTVQLKLVATNGTSFWASVSGARISYDKQDALVLLVTDIDQLYQTAVELEAALDVERRASDMQMRFLAIVAHELRTPLAIIDNTAQLLERGAETNTAEQVKARSNRIRATVQRMINLLENTLENSRQSLGGMGYDPQTGPIDGVIRDVGKAFARTNPSLRLSIDLPVLPRISFDRALIEQALANLLSNAIKYSEGIPRVEITAAVSSDSIQVLVRDYGIGIPENERSNVFTDFVRAENVGERPGTGLGLAIVRRIAGLHGGLVDILEADGPGTTIRLTLPRP